MNENDEQNGVNETITRICESLDNAGLRYQLTQSGNAIELVIRDAEGVFHIMISIEGSPLLVLILIEQPIVVPEKTRPQMAELVARLSCGLKVGSYQLDMRDGDLVFVASILLADARIEQEQFLTVFGTALNTSIMDHRAFSRLCFCNDLSPCEAAAEVQMAKSA